MLKKPAGEIKSTGKLLALNLARNNSGRWITKPELERELNLTPNQRQRVFNDLARDNRISFVIRGGAYFFREVDCPPVCEYATSCDQFSLACSESCNLFAKIRSTGPQRN